MSIVSLMDSGFCALLKKIFPMQGNPVSYSPKTLQVCSLHLAFTCISCLLVTPGRGLTVFLKHTLNFPNIIHY